MSILLCGTCSTHFDSDIQCEAEYLPFPKCEDCLQELEKQQQEWWTLLDQDEQAIEDFCEDKL